MPGEADLVACLDGGRDVPCVGGVGEDLASDEGLDAALLEERDLLGVAEVGVGLVLDDGGRALDCCGKETADGIGLRVPVDFPDDRRGGLGAFGRLPQLLDLPGLVGLARGRCLPA